MTAIRKPQTAIAFCFIFGGEQCKKYEKSRFLFSAVLSHFVVVCMQ